MKKEYKNIPTILGTLFFIFALQFFVIWKLPGYHEALKQFYYILIILGGYLFGVGGGIFFGLLSFVASTIHIFLHSNMIYLDFILQLLVFCTIGYITGFFPPARNRKGLCWKTPE